MRPMRVISRPWPHGGRSPSVGGSTGGGSYQGAMVAGGATGGPELGGCELSVEPTIHGAGVGLGAYCPAVAASKAVIMTNCADNGWTLERDRSCGETAAKLARDPSPRLSARRDFIDLQRNGSIAMPACSDSCNVGRLASYRRNFRPNHGEDAAGTAARQALRA